MSKHPGGRPKLTEKQKDGRKRLLLLKIAPHLKIGLSVNKALREAKIFNSEFYKYMREDEFFGEEIARYRQYISVLVTQILFKELLTIIERQNGNPAKNIPPQYLSKRDQEFLWWYALNSNLCREEYGRRENTLSCDPEAEIQRIKSMLEADKRKTYL